jgi:DNA integrity scanning protein DisA with diadenylate cyclase activity
VLQAIATASKMQLSEYIPAIGSVRNVIDIVLVFIIVYVVLKLLRGTRAVPTVVELVFLSHFTVRLLFSGRPAECV